MKLRILEKDGDNILSDKTVDLKSECSPLEQPAYVEYNDYHTFVVYEFCYSDSTELADTLWINDENDEQIALVRIGNNSGRINYAWVHKNCVDKLIKISNEYFVSDYKSVRYNNNVVNGIKMLKELFTVDSVYEPSKSILKGIIDKIDEIKRSIEVLDDIDEANLNPIKESTIELTDGFYKVLVKIKKDLTENLKEYSA